MFRPEADRLPVCVIVPAGPCVNINFAGSTVILSGPAIALGLLDSLVGLPAARATEHYRCLHPVGHGANMRPDSPRLPARMFAKIKLTHYPKGAVLTGRRSASLPKFDFRYNARTATTDALALNSAPVTQK
jgi:hypothetical protein